MIRPKGAFGFTCTMYSKASPGESGLSMQVASLERLKVNSVDNWDLGKWLQ